MRQGAPSQEVFKDIEQGLLRLTPPQVLVLSFVGLSLIGTLLLKLPIASHQPTSWMQALFTAVSAATVTGLVVIDTGTHFTLFGQWVLLILMQSGGVGLMTFGVFVIYLTSGQITLRHRAALREALNQTGPGDLRRVLLSIVAFTAIMEVAGTALLALHWVPELGWARGLYYSFFHAVSAFNSAGFVLPGNNLMNYVGIRWSIP